MVNYSIDTYHVQGDYIAVLSALEVKIDSLDSTINPIYLLDVVPNGNSYVGVLVYEA